MKFLKYNVKWRENRIWNGTFSMRYVCLCVYVCPYMCVCIPIHAYRDNR